MPQRSGAPLRPRPKPLVIYPTNLKSIVGQYGGKDRGRIVLGGETYKVNTDIVVDDQGDRRNGRARNVEV